MLVFNSNRNTRVKVKNLAAADDQSTYICGWLLENWSFMSLMDEHTLGKIFDKLVYLIDIIADELDSRYRENGFAVNEEKRVKKNSRHLMHICENLRSYGFLN